MILTQLPLPQHLLQRWSYYKIRFQWFFPMVKSFQSTYNTNVNDIAVDQNNNVYVTGATEAPQILEEQL